MKILVVFTFDISLKNWHEKGLLERELLIYKKLAKDGYKIGLLTYGDSSDLEFKRYLNGLSLFPIYSYIKRPESKIFRVLFSFSIPFKLGYIFKDYDVYKTNQMLGSWVAVIAKFLYRKRLIVRCGYEWLKNAFRESRALKRFFLSIFGYIMEFISYGASDKIVVSSISIKNFIKRAFRPFLYKVVYIPNFVDTESFKNKRADISYDNRVLYIGRLNNVKNLMNLFEAVKRSAFKVGIDIIGNGDSLKELKEFTSGNNIDVEFRGTMPNDKLPFEINKYPVFVLVSHFENNPKALLEAMACGRVVVGSNVEGIKEIIEDNISGILVSTEPDGIKEGLERAFKLSEDKKIDMCNRARDYVMKTSTIDIIFNKEKKIYKELAGD